MRSAISWAMRRNVRAMPASSRISRRSARSLSGGGGRGVTSEIVPDKEVAEHAPHARGTDDADRPDARVGGAGPAKAQARRHADGERRHAQEAEVQLALDRGAHGHDLRARRAVAAGLEPDV